MRTRVSKPNFLSVDSEKHNLRSYDNPFPAQVAAVDTDAQTCTVQFVDEVSNGNGHGASEATVGVKSVRHRYQDGHIALVDKGFEALGRCVTKFCVRVSCFFDDANTEKTNLVRGEV